MTVVRWNSAMALHLIRRRLKGCAIIPRPMDRAPRGVSITQRGESYEADEWRDAALRLADRAAEDVGTKRVRFLRLPMPVGVDGSIVTFDGVVLRHLVKVYDIRTDSYLSRFDLAWVTE